MPKPKLISKLSLQLPNFWLMFPMLCKLSQPQSGKGDLLMVLGQSLLPRRGTLPRGKPSLVSCLLKAFSSSGQAQGLLPLWSLFWLLQFTMIIFLSEPFLNLDAVVLVTHNMLFFSFLLPELSYSPVLCATLHTQLRYASLSEGFPSSYTLRVTLLPGLPKHPFPSLLAFPPHCVIAIYIILCPILLPEC